MLLCHVVLERCVDNQVHLLYMVRVFWVCLNDWQAKSVADALLALPT